MAYKAHKGLPQRGDHSVFSVYYTDKSTLIATYVYAIKINVPDICGICFYKDHIRIKTDFEEILLELFKMVGVEV